MDHKDNDKNNAMSVATQRHEPLLSTVSEAKLAVNRLGQTPSFDELTSGFKAGNIFVIQQISIQLDIVKDSLTGDDDDFSKSRCEQSSKPEPPTFIKTVGTVRDAISSYDEDNVRDMVHRLVSFGTEVAQAADCGDIIKGLCQSVMKANSKRLLRFEDISVSTYIVIRDANRKLVECIRRLERQVDSGIVCQFVNVFLRPTKRLNEVVDAICNQQSKGIVDDLLKKFHDHLDAVYQVCDLTVAFGSCGVICARRIRTIAKVLKNLDLELIGSVVRQTASPIAYLHLIRSTWIQCMDSLTKSFDRIVNPAEFVRFSVDKMKQASYSIKSILHWKHQQIPYEDYEIFARHMVRIIEVNRVICKELPDESYTCIDTYYLITRTNELERAHQASVKKFRAFVENPNGFDVQRKFIQNCEITIDCAEGITGLIKPKNTTNIATTSNAERNHWPISPMDITLLSNLKGWRNSASPQENTSTTTTKAEVFSLGLTDILENLRVSTCQVSTVIESCDSPTTADVRASVDESSSNFVDSAQSLCDLEAVTRKIDDIFLKETEKKTE